MRAGQWSAYFMLLFALAGCQSLGHQNLPQTPEQKLLSYSGAVESFTKPITLRYHAVHSFDYSYQQTVLFGPSKKSLSLNGKGSIQSSHPLLRVKLAVSHISVGKDQLASHDDAPLVESEELIDPRGIVKQFVLDTAPLQRRGWDIPKKGTPQFQEFIYPFEQVVITFPRKSVAMEAPIKGWHDGEQPFLNLARRILPKGSVTRNTLVTRASGVTSVNGQRHLVVRRSGAYRLQSGKDFVDLRLNGYTLVDMQSDLATSSVLQVHISVFKQHKHLPGYEATIERSIIPTGSQAG